MAVERRLVIAGGGGFGREVAAWAAHAHQAGLLPPVAGFIDDRLPEPPLQSAAYLGTISSFSPGQGDLVILAVGHPATKAVIANSLRERGAQFARLIHPSAVQGGSNAIGEGVIMAPFSMNTVDTKMGDFVTLLSFSGLGHDAAVGSFSTISSHVDIMGGASLGERVFIGSGARVMPRIRVGDDAVIGAGAVALRRVKRGATLYVPPAKLLTRS